LGVFIVSSLSFKCSLVYAKRSFYATVNGLFGKLLNLAPKEVILELSALEVFLNDMRYINSRFTLLYLLYSLGLNVPQFYYTG